MKRKDDPITDTTDITRNFCKSSVLNFTRYFFVELYHRKFIIGRHHKLIAEQLDRVISGEVKRLIINIAPRFGKTELAVKNFIAYGFSINPKARFIHLSYSDGLVRLNSAGVQDIMRTPKYGQLFPGTQPTSRSTKAWDTQGGGGLYAVSSAGQVTGFGAGLVDEEEQKEITEAIDAMEADTDNSGKFGGAIIIDDPIKPDDALSPVIRDKVNQKFDTTIKNRVNSRNTPIIIIMQRLHEEDLCGYLLKNDTEKWEVLSLPAMTTDTETGEREALWPFKFNLDELDRLAKSNPYVFETQYMQNPKPLHGLMYEQGFKIYEIPPQDTGHIIKNYTDTADTGKDYLCSITYIENDSGNFILDVIYTQKPMEYTEIKVAEALTRYNVHTANIESNNGGRGFARNVEANIRKMGNAKTYIRWFAQSKNKATRIFTHSADVQNLVYFPVGWEQMWPDFARDIKNHLKTGDNAHDDAPDALTGTIEFRKKATAGRAADFF